MAAAKAARYAAALRIVAFPSCGVGVMLRTLASVSWEIGANLGRHERAGVDAKGWLWEITRGDQAAHVVIEITGRAWSSDPLRLSEDTRQALETDERPELRKVLDQDVHLVRDIRTAATPSGSATFGVL
jgi:hypothetical protein